MNKCWTCNSSSYATESTACQCKKCGGDVNHPVCLPCVKSSEYDLCRYRQLYELRRIAIRGLDEIEKELWGVECLQDDVKPSEKMKALN